MLTKSCWQFSNAKVVAFVSNRTKSRKNTTIHMTISTFLGLMSACSLIFIVLSKSLLVPKDRTPPATAVQNGARRPVASNPRFRLLLLAVNACISLYLSQS